MAGEKAVQLSPNSLNLFLECSHCFWLDKNLGIKRPQPYAFGLNATLDELLKEEFDAYRAKKLRPELLEKNDISAKLFSSQRIINQWRNPSVGLRFYDEDLKATLFCVLDDALEFPMRSKEVAVVPLDYKSTGQKISKVYDAFQLHMDVATYLLQKNGYKIKRKGYLAFYVIDKSKGFLDKLPFQKKIVEIETDPGSVRELFREAVNMLREGQPPKHSRDCHFAKYLEKAKQFAH